MEIIKTRPAHAPDGETSSRKASAEPIHARGVIRFLRFRFT
jgi:hypothetical protein